MNALNAVRAPHRFHPTLAAVALVAAAIAVPAAPVLADPPAHAPAHGWRKKHDPDYAGYSGKKWKEDYGILQGTCNRQAIGAALGGAVGGAIGSQVGQGDGQKIATIVGAIIGAAIGAKIGKDLDAGDRACVAHAVELVQVNRSVGWSNPQTGVVYKLTPVAEMKRNGQACRDYTLQMSTGGRSETTRGTACRAGPGAWKIG